MFLAIINIILFVLAVGIAIKSLREAIKARRDMFPSIIIAINDGRWLKPTLKYY